MGEKVLALSPSLCWCTRLPCLYLLFLGQLREMCPISPQPKYAPFLMASSRVLIERASTSIAFGSFCGVLFRLNGHRHPVFCCPQLSCVLPSIGGLYTASHIPGKILVVLPGRPGIHLESSRNCASAKWLEMAGNSWQIPGGLIIRQFLVKYQESSGLRSSRTDQD